MIITESEERVPLTKVPREDGHSVAFLSELAGDGAAEIGANADNGGDSLREGGACH